LPRDPRVRRWARLRDADPANLLGLPEEARDFIERLPVGQGFVRSHGLMLAQVHEIPRPKVWDKELSKTVPNRQDVATSPAHRKNVENKVARLPALAKDALFTIARAEAVTPSSLRALLRRSQSSVNGALSRLMAAGLVAYRTANAGPGRPPSIYFLMPEGLEAFRQETGSYPDRVGTDHDHKHLVEAAVAALGVARLHHERFDILYEAEGEQRAVEVETGANNDDFLSENLAKMIDLQGVGQFVAADDRAYNRILQTCARWTYTNKKSLTLRIAFPAELPEWTQYTFRTEEPTTP
jgi:DNA-binding MarR family transcriptional regulator